MKIEKKYRSKDLTTLKYKILDWTNRFDIACFFDSNKYADPYSAFDILIAAGKDHEILANIGHAFDQLQEFLKLYKATPYIPGYLSYDLKNEIESIESKNKDGLQFPALYFFVPQHLILIKAQEIRIYSEDPDTIWNNINTVKLPDDIQVHFTGKINSRFSYSEYERTFNILKKHIYRGDIYEINFCQEFFASDAQLNPLHAFIRLNEVSPTPFANFFKIDHHYIISATPERFLCKRGDKLISQTIKGTIKREKDTIKDEYAKSKLRYDPKELSENVMIVDLVRHDLTKSAEKGSVEVEELFGIYSFKQVHQMISTIVCKADNNLSPVEIIRNTFPMGSMTGAPKVRAMQLIEQHERSKRGIYSGAVGYFSSNGNFDFNVIIRTILYNATEGYLSFQVGSAITLDANAKQEYEECMIKAQAIIEILSEQNYNNPVA